ncbi:MAG: radical SAM protein [Candidatus Thorarchaeota archaeon]|nr:radical SAM protein [Candidatus Thorarchaeota archaeon]
MLQYEGSIWRPPSEAKSLILQATVGCSHNACIFCVSYKNKRYRVRGESGIRKDLNRLSDRVKKRANRVFLADGNALAMDTAEMVNILNLLNEDLPNLERVGTYAYAGDVEDKTVDDLRRLQESGLGIVYLGLETGDDELLKWARKGVTNEENIQACKKIRAAGIPLSLTIILGLGGLEKSEQHAKATAEALNQIDPEYVGALTLMTPPGTPIHRMVQNEEFQPMKPFEILKELKILVENLELTECIFRTNHASNYLSLGGTLNSDKQDILKTLNQALTRHDEEDLKPSYMRGL